MKLTYKIIAAALAVIVVVVLVSAPLIYVGIQSTAAQLLVTIGQAAGNEYSDGLVNDKGEVPNHIGIDISVMSIFDEDAQGTAEIVKAFSNGDSAQTLKLLEPVIAPAIVFVIVLIILLVCAIVAVVVAFAAKDNRKVIYPCVAGAIVSLMAPECFEAIAEPFLNGDITLAKLAGSSWITLLGDIDKIELASVFWFVPVIFVAVILWTMLYNYTLPADEKKKRLEMIGEADSE